MRKVTQEVMIDGYTSTLNAVVGKKPKSVRCFRYLNIYMTDHLEFGKSTLVDSYILTDTADGFHVLMDAKGSRRPIGICKTYLDCQRLALEQYVKTSNREIEIIP